MTTEQFTYWLQGFFEISDSKTLGEKEVQIIKDHLKLVFNKQTPDYSKEINPLPNKFKFQTTQPYTPNLPNHNNEVFC